MKLFSAAPALSAFAALSLAASPAMAQSSADPSEADYAATARYSLPLLLGAVQNKCSPALSSEGFLATEGSTLQAKYAEGTDAYWPQAKRVFISMGEEREPGSTEFFTMLPDDSVRAIMDAALPELAVQDMNLDDCGTIERVIELMAPLPTDNVAGLAGLFFELVSNEEETEAEG